MSKEKFSKKLLVEGPDDQHVVWALCEKHELPETLPEEGLVLENQDKNKKAGIWIMPNNKAAGMLENFVSFLIPDGDALLPVVHSVLEKIESEKLNKYRDIHKSKAVIHSLYEK